MAGVDVWVDRRRRATDRRRFRVERMGGKGSEVVAEGGGPHLVRAWRAGGSRPVPVLFAEEFELLTLEPQGFVPLFAATQGKGHFDEVLHDDDPAVEGNFRCLVHFLDHARELGCQGEQEVFAGDVGKSSADGVLGKIADVFDAGAVVEPLLVGALPPFGQVLLGDETILEKAFHVMSHYRIGVKPTEDVFRGHIVHDLMIEPFTDVVRETGYFTFACGHRFACWFALSLVAVVEKAETLKS